MLPDSLAVVLPVIVKVTQEICTGSNLARCVQIPSVGFHVAGSAGNCDGRRNGGS